MDNGLITKRLTLRDLKMNGETGPIRDLVVREFGATVRETVLNQLRGNPPGTLVVLDLAGVETVDYSCADEVFAGLMDQMQQGEAKDRFLVLTGASTGHKENISAALERRKLALLLVGANGWEVLGRLESYLRDTLQLLSTHRTLSARALSDMGNIRLNTASTRLINLYKARLAYRVEESRAEGGHQYLYQSLV